MIQKIRIALIALSVVVVGYSAYSMLNAQFWGFTPMAFFFFSWTLIVTLFWKFFTKGDLGLKHFGLSTLSGFLFYLGFPTMPFTPLLFVAFIPLLIIHDDIYKQHNEAKKWYFLRHCFNAFIIWNILSTFWVANTSFAPSIAAFSLNALFMSIPMLFFHQVQTTISKRFSMVALICFWISFEYGHMAWEISWPWLTLGNAFAGRHTWVQWYEFTGHLGGSFWILLANILAYKIVRSIVDGSKVSINSVTAFVMLVVLPVFLSIIMYVSYQEKGDSKNVVVVQPNFEPHYQKFSVRKGDQLNKFIELSENALTDSTDYLVFPETSFFTFDIDRLYDYPQITKLREMMSGYPDLKLITGLISKRQYGKGEEIKSFTRVQILGGDTIYWEVQNSAVQLNNLNDSYPVHIKSKLVPGPEIFPYGRYLFFLKPIVQAAGGTLEGHARRDERTVFNGNNGAIVAPVICYESVYGEYVGEYVRKGAQAIFIVTNDGWWDDTPGHIQHLKFGALRAIEHRRAIARSANTGISCLINQRGDILQPTRYEEDAVVIGEIQFNEEITFYSKWGDILARIALFGAIILLTGLLLNTLKRRFGVDQFKQS